MWQIYLQLGISIISTWIILSIRSPNLSSVPLPSLILYQNSTSSCWRFLIPFHLVSSNELGSLSDSCLLKTVINIDLPGQDSIHETSDGLNMELNEIKIYTLCWIIASWVSKFLFNLKNFGIQSWDDKNSFHCSCHHNIHL